MLLKNICISLKPYLHAYVQTMFASFDQDNNGIWSKNVSGCISLFTNLSVPKTWFLFHLARVPNNYFSLHHMMPSNGYRRLNQYKFDEKVLVWHYKAFTLEKLPKIADILSLRKE